MVKTKNMKNIVLNILLVFTTITGKCQQDGIYWLEDSSESTHKIDVCLTLSNGYYSLDVISVISEDNIIEGTLSFGKFYKSCNKITLKDDIYDYVFKLRINEDGNLCVIKGFEPFVGRVFSGRKDYPYPIEDNRDAEKEQLSRLIRFHKNQTPYFEITHGIYQCGIMCYCALSFSEGKQYEYFFQGLKVSQGSWERQGNTIVLKDNKMKRPMYAFKEKTGINGSFLPGSFPSCTMIFIHDLNAP